MRPLLPAFLAAVIISSCSQARMAAPIPNWHNLDLQNDGVFGISTEKAYAELLKGKKARMTIVAVIDSGIDTTQEDLRPILWTDRTDGSHGRNYIGSETGKEDFIPVLETQKGDPGYRKTLDDYHVHVKRLESFMSQLKDSKKIWEQILKNIGKERATFEDVRKYQPRDEAEKRILDLVLDRLPVYPDPERLVYCELDHLLVLGQYHMDHGLQMGKAVADSTGGGVSADVSNDALGLVADPNVMSEHGTMMAGIIAAVRNNGMGADGIADHTRIMTLKLFNNIREMRNDHLANEATPIVAGLAALIMEYYPALTAVQVKEIIMRSVIRRTALHDKCVSGGVVNAYTALRLAAGH